MTNKLHMAPHQWTKDCNERGKGSGWGGISGRCYPNGKQGGTAGNMRHRGSGCRKGRGSKIGKGIG